MDRLLFFAGLGATGLLAELFGAMASKTQWLPRSRFWTYPARAALAVLAVIHLVVAPFALPFSTRLTNQPEAWMQNLAASLPDDPALERQTLVVINSEGLLAPFVLIIRALQGKPAPARIWNLGVALKTMRIRRLDARTLVLEPDGGFLVNPFGRLTRHVDDQLPPGTRASLTGLSVEVTNFSADRRPSEATFRFDAPLEDPSMRWVYRTGKALEPFRIPAIGETLVVPAAPVNLF